MEYYSLMKWSLFVLFAILQVLDVYSTHEALKVQGVYEANPVMRYLFDIFGPLPVMITSKIVALIVIAYFLMLPSLTLQVIVGFILVIGIFAYAYVVDRNFRNARKEQ